MSTTSGVRLPTLCAGVTHVKLGTDLERKLQSVIGITDQSECLRVRGGWRASPIPAILDRQARSNQQRGPQTVFGDSQCRVPRYDNELITNRNINPVIINQKHTENEIK